MSLKFMYVQITGTSRASRRTTVRHYIGSCLDMALGTSTLLWWIGLDWVSKNGPMSNSGMTRPVDLGVVSIGVRMKMMSSDKLQQVSSI